MYVHLERKTEKSSAYAHTSVIVKQAWTGCWAFMPSSNKRQCIQTTCSGSHLFDIHENASIPMLTQRVKMKRLMHQDMYHARLIGLYNLTYCQHWNEHEHERRQPGRRCCSRARESQIGRRVWKYDCMRIWLAWQNCDRLLCLQQTIRQPASKMKRKLSSYQKKTCCSCWTTKSRRYRFDLKCIQVTQEPQPAYAHWHANPQVCSRLFYQGWDKHTRFSCLNQSQISDLKHRGYEHSIYQLVAEALTQQC